MTLDHQQEIGQTISLMDDETKRLFSLSTAQEHDATFIRILLEFLYKDDISTLEHRSFTGRNRTVKKNQIYNADSDDADSYQSDKFKAISPKKKNTIFTLFRERIEKCNVTEHEKFTRVRSTRVIRLVGMGIYNLRKSNQASNGCPPNVRSSHSEK